MTKATKYKLIPLKILDNFVWKITSLAFRIDDADENGFVKCCTCRNKMFYYKSDAQMGHFVSRGKKWVKFERRNLSTQDSKCNIQNNGEQYKMGKFLDMKYGEGTADEIMQMGNKNGKFTRFDYKEYLIKNAKVLIEQSRKKGLWDWKRGLKKYELDILKGIYLNKLTADERIIYGKYYIP